MSCHLFENNGEDFDTGIVELNETLETTTNYSIDLEVEVDSDGTFLVGEIVEHTVDSDESDYLRGEVLSWDASINTLRLIHVGATSGEFTEFEVGQTIEGSVSGAVATITSIDENLGTEGSDQNDEFDEFSDDFIDFSESNPFGDM